jgi:hypothetical protein
MAATSFSAPMWLSAVLQMSTADGMDVYRQGLGIKRADQR